MSPVRKTKKQTQSAAGALERENRRRKLWSLLLFSLGILLIVFSFVGDVDAEEKNGADYINMFLRGMFGFAVFFVGPILIYISVMLSKSKGRRSVGSKLILLGFMILLISAGIQILFVGDVVLGELYKNGIELRGGGVAGALLAYPLMLFGRVTASILVILIVFVVVMLASNITLHEFLRLIATPFRKLWGTVKAKSKEYREDSEHLRMLHEENLKLETAVSEKEPVKAKQSREDKAIEKRLKFASIKAATDSVHKSDALPMPIFDNVERPETSPSDIHTEYQNELNSYINSEQSPHEQDMQVESAEVEKEDSGNAVLEAIEDYVKEGEEQAAQNQKNSQSLDFSKAEAVTGENIRESNENSGLFLPKEPQYLLPPVTLLNQPEASKSKGDVEAELEQNSNTLVETLKSFGVQTKIVGVCRGPSVTRYELQPAAGVKISKITGLIDDIALNLATAGVRIEAPIPNKAAVGIEVPNRTTDTVHVRSLIDSSAYRGNDSNLSAVIGMDISGEIIVCDIAKMPHILIAGTTGSGKSVCVNSIIMSILFRATPDDVRFVMIDPKAVEFMIYNGIPHLLIPVVTDPKKAAGALGWAVTEMLNRYKSFAEYGVRDLSGYNSLCAGDPELVKMPQIVIFIDELADLMMVAPGDVESGICRLAQMGRAAGIHLVIATQRPSVDVITGIIKANIPSRIALKVASQVDSRTIIDSAGADKLLGKGDMLFFPVGAPKPVRVQGCWVSEKEVERTAEFIKKSFVLDYDESVIEEIESQAELVGMSKSDKEKAANSNNGDLDLSDDKLDEAIEAVIEAGQASTSYLQRRLKLGYGRAARLIDIMEQMGVVGTFEGSKPRQVIMSKQEWYERKINKGD